MPKVTVLMSVYNGNRYLRQAIDSILQQTFQDFEFLIVNDGSTDSTRDIVLSYKDPRIRLIENTINIGLPRSLNRGLKLAEGQFIARQDADDVSEPERLAKQTAFLEAYPDVALLGTWWRRINEQGIIISNKEEPCECTQIRWSLLFFCPFVHTSVMFNKSLILNEIGYYNEDIIYGEDYELWSRIARHLPVANLNEYLVRFRANPWSMTVKYGKNVYEEEFFRARLTNMEHIFNWDKARVNNYHMRIHMIDSLLFGCGDEINLQELDQAVDEIFECHTAFCEYYRLVGSNCRSHLFDVYNRLSTQLMGWADHYFYVDKHAATQLLLKAFSINRSVFLTKQFIRLSLKILLGKYLSQSIINLPH